MGDRPGFVSLAETLVGRVLAFLSAASRALSTSLDRALRCGVYELRGEEIISGRGRHSDARIDVRDIVAWEIYPEMGFDVVDIELTDGRSLVWCDTYDDLIAILRQVAADRERFRKFN